MTISYMRQIIKKNVILNDNTLCERYISAEFVDFHESMRT